MSRLDTFIARMTAQRDLLNHIHANNMVPAEGAILEIGLGNGRTYSHLQQLFPDRRIIAFDRRVAAHRTRLPETENLVVGEIEETGLQFAGCNAALVHADIGTGYPEQDALILRWLPEMIVGMLRLDGIAVSGLSLNHPRLVALPELPTMSAGSYRYYRRV